MTYNYVLYALYEDTINNSELAGLAEARVQEQPDNALIRAHLLHYYHHLEIKYDHKEVSNGRLRHIQWFIENHPDLEFCGTARFYDRASSSTFGSIDKLWQEAISGSPEEMRKVNACMNLAEVDGPSALQLIKKLFPSNSKNIWVLALLDYLNQSASCFHSVVDFERSNLKVLDEDFRTNLLLELKSKNDWESIALRNFAWRDYDDTNILEILSGPLSDSEVRRDDVPHIFKSNFAPNMTMVAASKIAGATFYRFESGSVLHFNPEILSMRFQLACWVITRLPSSKLAISPIFVGPFESPRSYLICDGYFKPIECLYDYLAVLWAEQLNKFPADRTVARNAATFAIKCDGYFHTAMNTVVATLSQTKVGKSTLEKTKSKIASADRQRHADVWNTYLSSIK